MNAQVSLYLFFIYLAPIRDDQQPQAQQPLLIPGPLTAPAQVTNGTKLRRSFRLAGGDVRCEFICFISIVSVI